MTAGHVSGDFAIAVRAGREQAKRRHALKLGAPADREAMRGCDRDPDSGEAAGPDTNQDSRRRATGQQLGDHRHQPLGMAAADQLVGMTQASSGAVE